MKPINKTLTPVKYTISLIIEGKTPNPTNVAKNKATKLTIAPIRNNLNFFLILPTDLLIKINWNLIMFKPFSTTKIILIIKIGELIEGTKKTNKIGIIFKTIKILTTFRLIMIENSFLIINKETIIVEKKDKPQPILETTSYNNPFSIKFLDICINNGPKTINKINDPNANKTLFNGRLMSFILWYWKKK